MIGRYYICPECEGEFTNRHYGWCPWCGEKIDWEKASYVSGEE